ncbi:MAG: lytic transglycosylase domain-containing protein, partial [Sporichthyaceae bacterium]|nr:lytic transglycosylase domain-containing protein [Sporichthyaceae bacterium]
LLAAQGYVESGFNPNAVSPAGAQGIAQFMPGTYQTWGADADGDGVNSPFDPPDGIMAQGRLMCHLLNLSLAADYPGDPVQLALAGYNAGWGAVQAHRGIPPYEETRNYVRRVFDLAVAWISSAARPPSGALPPPPRPGPDGSGCTEPDPTGGRCLTPTTAWAYAQIRTAFGDVWRSIGCQQSRANGGEHPLGRACDYAPGAIGVMPNQAQLTLGWTLADWLRAHAGPLGVQYIIWAGRIWSVNNPADVGGWGRPFDGGLCGNPHTVTCGHHDHVHVSFLR